MRVSVLKFSHASIYDDIIDFENTPYDATVDLVSLITDRFVSAVNKTFPHPFQTFIRTELYIKYLTDRQIQTYLDYWSPYDHSTDSMFTIYGSNGRVACVFSLLELKRTYNDTHEQYISMPTTVSVDAVGVSNVEASAIRQAMKRLHECRCDPTSFIYGLKHNYLQWVPNEWFMNRTVIAHLLSGEMYSYSNEYRNMKFKYELSKECTTKQKVMLKALSIAEKLPGNGSPLELRHYRYSVERNIDRIVVECNRSHYYKTLMITFMMGYKGVDAPTATYVCNKVWPIYLDLCEFLGHRIN